MDYLEIIYWQSMDHISRQSVWIFRTSIDILFGCQQSFWGWSLFSKQHTNMWMQKQTHSCIEGKYKIHKSIMFQLSVTKIKWALINLLLTWQSLLLYKTIIILRQYPIKSNYHPMISLSIIEQIMSIYYSTELNEEIITCIAACSDPVCRKND